MLVYRDASRSQTSAEVRRELAARLGELPPPGLSRSLEERGSALALLLSCAEIETALEDAAGSGELEGQSALASLRKLTDASAEAWWAGAPLDAAAWARALEASPLPARCTLKRPEGYAYYALDPAAYARAALAVARADQSVLIAGIRSIGTSLSAIARAALRARGQLAERLSLRPTGHAWDRSLALNGAMRARLQAWAGAQCLVVDEGPGLSGSTFLAVGECLERAGFPAERTTFLISHAVDAAALIAPDAARRWARFRTCVAADRAPSEASVDLGAGRWREHVYASEREWPAVWASAERRKFRYGESLDLLKFVGVRPYAEAPLARAMALAEAGFCPRVSAAERGYLRQRWCHGEILRRPIDPELLDARLVPRMLEYLVFRREACRAQEASSAPLEEMTRVNLGEALHADLPSGFRLELVSPVYPDARLSPQEWVIPVEGPPIKVDAIDHGDDHFFPGPCDVAWDLAGAIVELDLDPARRSRFIERYRRQTGDDTRARLPSYLVAYSASRVGYLHLALHSAEAAERVRLARELDAYATRARYFRDQLGSTGV